MIDRKAESSSVVLARAEIMLQRHIAHAAPLEAATVHVFLPGCRACGERHPLAFSPPIETMACPKCGAPVQPPGDPILTESVVTGSSGPSAIAARALLRLGKWFARLAKRLEQ